ncbi:hypothetical protein EMPS_05353 [Entomortierella parvispora]|uniref:Alpha/beta hydrolase fold-3 domain-containing protein n=1 Tax=Entomortierella parvispora TaxID=205924 RepID=A0A9P3HAJ9_9FUNG|nr:hypothetical protein EMPS_05353 [Entomortierella parvispora]
MTPRSLQSLYTRSGTSSIDRTKDLQAPSQEDNAPLTPPLHHSRFPPPSIFQRAHLKGILYQPRDVVFFIRLASAVAWAMLRLHCIELPYLILTRFKYSTAQHPAAWPWFASVFFTAVRVCATKIHTLGQLRFFGRVIETALPLQLIFVKKIKVSGKVQFKVNLDILLRPERATLAELRANLKKQGYSDDPMNPSPEYLASMHPSASHKNGSPAPLANLPEEVGTVDADGTYKIRGEWIEALVDPKKPDPRPRSKTVILYFHGGAHVFCSPRTHTHLLAQIAREIGPGTRVFSVDYRMAPESPFPAAIHDAFAAYLYLTEPDHAALILDEDSAPQELAVDPRDIVVAGDSAGGNLAAAFMHYMATYVQPSTEPHFILPHATVLLSPWTDVTSSVPSAKSEDWYCYCPGPIGTSPLNKEEYFGMKTQNFGSNYVIGDPRLVLNSRNALGGDRRWEWYSSLVQHPLVSPAHSAPGSLQGLTNTLVQTATHDRLLDDGRLYAHRIGIENPAQLVRIETYKDMVHVHQLMTLLFKSSRVAISNIARFIERSIYLRDQQLLENDTGSLDQEGRTPTAMRSSSLLHKVSTRDSSTRLDLNQKKMMKRLKKTGLQGVEEEQSATQNGQGSYIPAFLRAGMITNKSMQDGVEWVMVEQNGLEYPGDEGWPIGVLIRSWPSPNVKHEKEE